MPQYNTAAPAAAVAAAPAAACSSSDRKVSAWSSAPFVEWKQGDGRLLDMFEVCWSNTAWLAVTTSPMRCDATYALAMYAPSNVLRVRRFFTRGIRSCAAAAATAVNHTSEDPNGRGQRRIKVRCVPTTEVEQNDKTNNRRVIDRYQQQKLNRSDQKKNKKGACSHKRKRKEKKNGTFLRNQRWTYGRRT